MVESKKRTGSPKDHDFSVKARNILEGVIGEHLDGTPLETPEENPKLVERARKAGLVGGKARARNLSKKRRSEIASKASRSRWKKLGIIRLA